MLKPIRIRSGKVITAWAVENDFEKCFICSNNFSLEWPVKSGKFAEFPEVDRADWFDMETARRKIYSSQVPLLEELLEIVSK